MKKTCSTCGNETGRPHCLGKHTRWKNANLELQSVSNCPDWKGRTSNGKRSNNREFGDELYAAV